MSTKPDLSDMIFRAFVARREFLRGGEGAGAIRIIGSRYSPEAMALRAFAKRSRLPHTWIDLEDVDDAAVSARGPRPAPERHARRDHADRACCGSPTPGEFAEHLGPHVPRGARVPVRPRRRRHRSGRPGGRGVRRVGGARHACRSTPSAIGGQAGASSRIENYVGFPNGDLGRGPRRRAPRSRRSGSARGSTRRARSPACASRTASTCVVLADGSEIPTRAVIVASGARYRRLDGRRPRTVRRRRRVLRGHRSRSARVPRLRRDRRRRRQLGRARPRSTSRSRAARCRSSIRRDDLPRQHVALPRSSASRPTRASSCCTCTEVRALDGRRRTSSR